MCYADTYSCTVTCINSALNRTRLAEGVVISDAPFNGCRITCAEAVRDTAMGLPMETGTASLFAVTPIKVLGLLMVLAGVAVLWYLYLKQKEGDK